MLLSYPTFAASAIARTTAWVANIPYPMRLPVYPINALYLIATPTVPCVTENSPQKPRRGKPGFSSMKPMGVSQRAK